MASHDYGTYLYLLKEREHVRCGDDGAVVCKVGFTTDFVTRMRAYPDSSTIILTVSVRRESVRQAARLVLGAFERCFKQRNDIGDEYFEGAASDMVAMIVAVSARYIHPFSKNVGQW